MSNKKVDFGSHVTENNVTFMIKIDGYHLVSCYLLARFQPF